MIAIVNRGENGPLHHYTVQINDKVVAEFDHNRDHGLAVCLLEAAEAVRRQEIINLTGLRDELRKNSL